MAGPPRGFPAKVGRGSGAPDFGSGDRKCRVAFRPEGTLRRDLFSRSPCSAPLLEATQLFQPRTVGPTPAMWVPEPAGTPPRRYPLSPHPRSNTVAGYAPSRGSGTG